MTSSTWSTMIEHYLTFREVSQGRSKQTSVKYRLHLTRLLAFCKQAGITPAQATPDHLETFTGVYVYKEMNMGPMARRAVVAAVRGFYKWLEMKGHLPNNPSIKVEYPKAPQKLPEAIPFNAAERLMWQPDLTTFRGIRDAAMLGLLIGCGIRITGLVRLNFNSLLWDSDHQGEYLSIVVLEKGDKERMVPVPDQARLLIRAYLGHAYLDTVDPTIDNGDRVLFISTANRNIPASDYYGENMRISANSVRNMIVKYGEQAGIPRKFLHPHAMRHLFGKQLTEGDVDVIDRMALMGHADFKSSQIYSHIADKRKRAHITKHSPLSTMSTPVSDLSKILQRASDSSNKEQD